MFGKNKFEDVPLKENKEGKEEVFAPIERDSSRNSLIVLETEIPINQGERGDHVPSTEKFANFTLDKPTLMILEKVATAVELRDPCLLEGLTGTAKTSSIEYLAMMTNNQCLRLNLNGQTDTTELIGKFVPNDSNLETQFQMILKYFDRMSESSQSIVKAANLAGRGLTLEESKIIAEKEGIESPEWHWKDGIIPEAMRNGYWVILDEINLAAPQVLERLNSVLERDPSITLSEQGNVRIAANSKANPLDERFRIFATMNPPEYSGRTPMSPAYKNRWTSYMYVPNPGEEEYFAMGLNIVYGEQPDVEIRDVKYHGDRSEPKHESLAQIPNFRSFLAKYAKFQARLEMMAAKEVIGKDLVEPYVFTRRNVLEFFEYLETHVIIDRKQKQRITMKDDPARLISYGLRQYYLDQLHNDEDRQKVIDLLDAAGIGPNKFTVDFTVEGESAETSEDLDTWTKMESEHVFEIGDQVITLDNSPDGHSGSMGKIISIDGEVMLIKYDGGCKHEVHKDYLRYEPSS